MHRWGHTLPQNFHGFFLHFLIFACACFPTWLTHVTSDSRCARPSPISVILLILCAHHSPPLSNVFHTHRHCPLLVCTRQDGDPCLPKTVHAHYNKGSTTGEMFIYCRMVAFPSHLRAAGVGRAQDHTHTLPLSCTRSLQAQSSNDKEICSVALHRAKRPHDGCLHNRLPIGGSTACLRPQPVSDQVSLPYPRGVLGIDLE